MVVDRCHIHILDVISVILFSVFGSYLVAVDTAFNENVTIGEVLRLFFVLASGTLLYFAVFKMKRIDEEAKRDFHSETDLSKKAKSSIDERYRLYFRLENTAIFFRLTFSIVFLAGFISLAFWSAESNEFIDHSLCGEQTIAQSPELNPTIDFDHQENIGHDNITDQRDENTQ